MSNANAIHIWVIRLDDLPIPVKNLNSALSEDEFRRAARLVVAVDRSRWLKARAALRQILSRHLRIPSKEIVFGYGKHGKPKLTFPDNGTIFFNLSHSRDLAVVAVTETAPIGVDTECIRAIPEIRQIAGHFFHPDEAQRILAAHGREQMDLFFRCWVRKEAILKAQGTGLAHPIDLLPSLLQGRDSSYLIKLRGVSRMTMFRLFDICLPPGYVGSLAVRTRMPCVLRPRYFSELDPGNSQQYTSRRACTTS